MPSVTSHETVEVDFDGTDPHPLVVMLSHAARGGELAGSALASSVDLEPGVLTISDLGRGGLDRLVLLAYRSAAQHTMAARHLDDLVGEVKHAMLNTGTEAATVGELARRRHECPS